MKPVIAFLIILFLLSCGDGFIGDINTEKITSRKGNKTFALVSGTTTISLTESVESGKFTARLSERPVAEVVLDFSKSEQFCTTEGVGESIEFIPDRLVFTPSNYMLDQTAEVVVVGDNVVRDSRHHRVYLPPLESTDPLYGGVTTKNLDVTVFEDDTFPLVYASSPYMNESLVSEHGEIILVFNREMDAATINYSSFALYDDSDNVVPAYIRHGADNKIAYLSPKQYLNNGKEYHAEVRGTIKDVYGNLLYQGINLVFQTRLFEPKIIGSCLVNNGPRQIVVQGNYAFVVYDTQGLKVIDITNPSSPVIRGVYSIPSTSSSGVAVTGNYAYVGFYKSFRVVNISNPSNPSPVRSLTMPDTIWGITINGNYAYLAVSISGLRVLNITNPSNPVVIGVCDTPGACFDAAISGNYAYIADGSSGVQVINISNPSNPVLIKSIEVDGAAEGITVSGSYVYVAVSDYGLKIIDITDPLNPVIAGGVSIPGRNLTNGVAVVGNRAYLAVSGYGVNVVDVSDPTSPVVLGGVAFSANDMMWGIAARDNMVYCSSYYSFHAVDVSPPHGPVYTGTMTTPADAVSVHVDVNRVFFALGESGVGIADVSNPVNPVYKGGYDTNGWSHSIVTSGNYAYVADGDSGIQVLDVTNMTLPALIGTCPVPGIVRDIALADGIAVVAADTSGVYTVDISNQDSPEILGSIGTFTKAVSVAVNGNYACVADDGGGLRIIDMADPANPQLAGSWEYSNPVTSVCTYSNYAYLADGTSGIHVIDISDPDNPLHVATLGTSVGVRDISVHGDRLFCAGNGELVIIDISIPSSPVITDVKATAGTAMGIAASMNYAFVADGASGVAVYRHPYGP